MAVVTFLPGNFTVEVSEGAGLLDAAKLAGIHADTPCGGRGLCKKCLVQIVSGEAVFENNGALPDGLLKDGYVLLCRAKVKTGPVTVNVFSDRNENEEGKFSNAKSDLNLVDSALFPKQISPLVQSVQIQVPPPIMADGLSDADRLSGAAADRLGSAPNISLSVLRLLPETLRADQGRVTGYHTAENGRNAFVDVAAGDKTEDYGIAVDIGTTTVAVLLVNMSDGAVIGSRTEYNAQVACGLDIISRINYAQKPERLEELKQKVLGTINGIVQVLCKAHNINAHSIRSASVAGNTTMVHLLLGIIPEYIRLEPYTPAVYAPPLYRAQEIGIEIHPEAPVYIAPGVGSYVGGDITSGLLCTPLAAGTSDMYLFIDVGTNGEIVLGNHDFLMGCACSAGPAFEGGGIEKGMRASVGAIERVEVDKETGISDFAVIGSGPAIGICGSGMISLVAGLFETGWLDPAGRFDRIRKSDAVQIDGKNARYIVDHPQKGGKGEIFITEADIDNLIRAKAAIFSACRTMLGKVGMSFEDIAKFYIAGGFGRYLNITNAKTIGLIPELPEDKYVFLGNASVSGAYMTLLSESHRKKQAELAAKVTYLDLSTENEYMNEYTAALFLPHTDQGLFKK
ncbi:MAG TPA: ASKHA domain-containing protein [Oscillospiraceae bacterium]|nr:ASKHA domain-containing protein [Oscillospiraceae bacterium]HPS34784.1 ASKHA domain-containing protein [Oscillospiraceae bacterium]